MSDDATPFEVLPAEEVERLLPSYSQMSFLAQGGMASVYRGVQTTLDRPVAIKILPREFGTDESFRLRFEAEGKAMAKLNHPNLVSIFDFGEVDGLLYLVMEFVEGVTLHEEAYGKPMDNLAAVDLCQKVAAGLANAHRNGILHRDVKPANVLLDAQGNPKLGDFGLAEGDERAEGDDLVFGTPGYTSPEVMANPIAADEKADIFAIGVMLHELLTTELPTEPYQAPSRLVQSDPRIDAVIKTAIQPDPALRYASADDLATALKDLHAGMKAAPRRKLASSGKASGSGAAVLATGSNTGGPAVPQRPAPSSSSSSRGSNLPFVRNLIIIGILSVAIFAVWNAMQDKQARIDKKEAKQQAEIDRKKEREEAAAQRAREEREAAILTAKKDTQKGSKGSSTSTTPQEPLPSLTPREQLEELQSALLAGDRESFPEGTIQRGTSHYFFIEDELTWYQAIDFAERYGAHLAITPKKNDLGWLAKQNPSEKDIWLGAGAISKSDWAWLDEGIEYELTKPRTSTGTAAMVTKIGIIKARQPALKLPFFIQWYNNGKQPGTRELDLTNLAKSLTTSSPSWPPGTFSFQERRYLIIGSNLTLAEAGALASKGKGHLAVPSNELEASFLIDTVEKAGLSSLWIGGEQRNGSWIWRTNEPWDFAKWNEGFPQGGEDASGLQVNTTGWLNANPLDEAPGFIIEWSDDAKKVPETENNNGGGALEELASLRTLAKRFLAKKQVESNAKRSDNFAAQGMRVRQWFRSLSTEDALTYKRFYDQDSSLFEANDNRLSPPQETNLGKNSRDAADILDNFFELQKKADQELLLAAEQLRISYLAKIETLLNESKEKGLSSQIPTLEKEMKATGTSGRSFMDYLNADSTKSSSITNGSQADASARLNILEAIFGTQTQSADVTTAVQGYLAQGTSFIVEAEDLGIDPAPGKNKTLRVSYTYGGETYAANFQKSQLVSNKTLIKQAQ